MKCANCSKDVRDDLAFCPHCGTKVSKTSEMTPGQAAAAAAVLESLGERMRSTLKKDPQSIAATKRYLEAARLLFEKFSKVFEVFTKEYSPAKAGPSLLRDPKRAMTAKVVLLAVVGTAHGGLDPKKPDIVVPEMPDGCFSVQFELMKIQLHSEDLAKRYMAYLEHGGAADLEAAREAAAKLEDRIPRAFQAIDKIAHEIEVPA